MGMVLDQNQGATAASHTQDCMFESCLSPSLGWLSPARVSLSNDFSVRELDSVGEIVDCMNGKAAANDSSPVKGKDRAAKDSMSDFEFAMAMGECDQTVDHGRRMLAADELFFKGKLLPLYVPQFMSDDLEQSRRIGHQQDRKVIHRCSDSDIRVMSSSSALSSSFSSSCSMSCTPLHQGTMASTQCKEGMNIAFSKPAKCSSKLRELFGLKRSPTALLLALKTSKFSPESDTKQRTTTTDVMSPFQTWGKAKRLFCRSDKNRDKVPEGRSSTSESLLSDRCDGRVPESMPSFGCPVISLSPQHQSLHQHAYSKKSHMTNSSHNSSSLCSQITRMQRSNRVSHHGDDAFAKAPSLQQLRVLREVKNPENYTSMRVLTSCKQVPIKEDLKPTVYRSARKPSLQGFAYYGGSSESSPARRSSGAISPAENSGQWSPVRLSPGLLLSGCNTNCSSCWGSPGRHSMSSVTQCYSPGRLSCGIEQLSLSALDTGDERLTRARSLERTSSSPNSHQRKYDQMRALRQRDGWRAGLERSSSYNNMSSVRVAPVLNVPRVCAFNRLSKSNSNGQTHSSSNNGGRQGLGHLFSTKVNSRKTPSRSNSSRQT